MQKRIEQEITRVLKRESDLEDHQFNLQRDRAEFESEKSRFRNQQTKELQRLEKRLEETMTERQNALESLAEEKHAVDAEKRNLKETIRGIEERCSLEVKKKQLNLESAMEHVVDEQKLLLEKSQNVERERANLKEKRERFEREKLEIASRKIRLDSQQHEIQHREEAFQETISNVAKMKQESDRALHQAKFMDEEHKTRVAKLNMFLEQLKERELGVMRRAVENQVHAGQRAIQMPSGTVAISQPRRNLNDVRIQLIPNPAQSFTEQTNWQNERDYLQNLKSTPWTTKLL